MKPTFALPLLLLAVLVAKCAQASDPQILEVQAGQTADAYFEINMSGKVFVHIAAKLGEEACAEFWWIKWPLGNVQSLGRHCNSATFEIPGVLSFTLSSKLRVRAGPTSLKLAVSASESVANSVTFTF